MKIWLTSGGQKWLITSPHKGGRGFNDWHLTSPLSGHGLSICPNLRIEIRVDAVTADSGDTVCRP